MENEKETLELLKWLSKAIIAINWFSGCVQAGINTLTKKIIAKFFPNRKFCWETIFSYQALFNMLHNIFFHVISKSFDLKQMRMR